jgi:hypothetical protein
MTGSIHEGEAGERYLPPVTVARAGKSEFMAYFLG